jgi:hypothetical protein
MATLTTHAQRLQVAVAGWEKDVEDASAAFGHYSQRSPQ